MFGRDKQQGQAPQWFGAQVPTYPGGPGAGFMPGADAGMGQVLEEAQQVMQRAQEIMAAVTAFEQRRRAARPSQARLGMGMSPGADMQGDVAVAVGLRLSDIDPSGPAAQAGLYPGDLLLTFNGVPVSLPTELTYLVTSDMIGRPVPVTIRRGGGEGQLMIVPAPPQ